MDWYAAQSARALSRFAEEVESTLTRIESSPNQYPLVDERHRQAILNKFPYFIAFRMIGKNPLIVTIRHTSRDKKPFEPYG